MPRANAKTLPGLIAHRGAPSRYPENTLAGYKAVLNMAMLHPQLKTFIEVDVRSTRDDVAIALHDKQLDRTTKGSGPCCDHDWGMLTDILCHDVEEDIKEGELDFEALQRERGSNTKIPLWEIKKPDDYRIPTIAELLELTRVTNKHLMTVGYPVGICLDLKAKEPLPALAKTLKEFSEEHANAVLPMLALGIETRVGEQDMRNFWEMLPDKARRYFYETPELVTKVIHKANLHVNTGPGFSYRAANALQTAIYNMAFPWRMIGAHHDMLGSAKIPVAGNYHCLTNEKDVRAAAKRQDLIWVDNIWDSMQIIDEMRKDGKFAAAPARAEIGL